MKSRQVGLVLMALIAVGLAGLIIRAVSSGSDEVVLSGLLPLSEEIIDKVVLKSGESQAELVRVGNTWLVGTHEAFPFKVDQLWDAVSDLDGAQLIATNPDNHPRMGVTKEDGTTVYFYLGPSLQEQFIVGEAKPDVLLCYLRRAGKDDVYGIPCPLRRTFDPDPDGWRNPIVVAIPRRDVESVTFTYPDEEFVLKRSEGDWVVVVGGEEKLADLFQVDGVLTALEVMVARGFATDAEAKGLEFDAPDASLRVVTKEGASSPTTRLRFIRRDDISYYARTPVQATVFVLDERITGALLKGSADLLGEEGG